MANETVEKLSASEQAGANAALLLSAGVLMGLGMKNKLVRRLAGFACAALTAGLAVPLIQDRLDRKRKEDDSLIDLRFETGSGADGEPVFQFQTDASPAGGTVIPPEKPQTFEESPASGEPQQP